MKELQELVELAGFCSVGFTLQYSEAENTWYATIDSAAPSECREFKRFQLDSILEHLRNALLELKSKYPAQNSPLS